jgi:hypothetical protein
MIGDWGALVEDRFIPLKTPSFTPSTRYQSHGDENRLNSEVILKVLHKYYLESETHHREGVRS